jgi:hypothetical protein
MIKRQEGVYTMLYYYISGLMGMTSNGSFTKDKSRWITFTEEESKRIIKPYAATKAGLYISCNKFR